MIIYLPSSLRDKKLLLLIPLLLASFILLLILSFHRSTYGLYLASCLNILLCFAFFKQNFKLISFLPAFPLFIFPLGIFIRAGVGSFFLSLGIPNSPFTSTWSEFGLFPTLLWTPFLLLILYLPNFLPRSLSAYLRYSDLHTQFASTFESKPNLSSFFAIYHLLTAFFLASTILSLFSGTFSREFATYSTLVGSLWKLDSIFLAFSRLRDLWFFLLPSFLYLSKSFFLKATSLVLLCTYYFFIFLSGSRGLVLYPLLLLTLGIILLPNRRLYIKLLLPFFVVASLVLTPLLYAYRLTGSFMQPTQSIVSRSQSVVTVQKNILDSHLFINLHSIGRDLYACHDPYLFTPSNASNPPRLSSNLPSFSTLFIPRHFYPLKQSPFDGHLIAKQLQGVKPSAWSSVWFPCISFPADLYRRWHLPGLLLGSSLFAFMLTHLNYLWFRCLQHTTSSFRLLSILLPVTYIQSFSMGTLSETLWFFTWDLLKYLLLLFFVGTALDKFLVKQ